jgi:hypothetical protein
MTTNQPLDLDAIETVISAATPGPWGVYESGFVIEIAADLEETGHGYRAHRGICRLDEEPLDNDPAHRGWMAEEDWAQVQADAAFIAAMSPETARAMAAEIRRLRDQLTAVTALCDEQDMAARMFELPTPEWIAAVRRAIEDAVEETHVVADDSDDPDTLPAWLAQRFDPRGPDWDALSDDDRAYWEHQAAAVRRAVARGGFKTDPAAVPAAARP